jgi:hypothetical protein
VAEEQIDYQSRYETLVGLCRFLCWAVRGIQAKKSTDAALKILETEQAIDRKLVAWGEIDKR